MGRSRKDVAHKGSSVSQLPVTSTMTYSTPSRQRRHHHQQQQKQQQQQQQQHTLSYPPLLSSRQFQTNPVYDNHMQMLELVNDEENKEKEEDDKNDEDEEEYSIGTGITTLSSTISPTSSEESLLSYGAGNETIKLMTMKSQSMNTVNIYHARDNTTYNLQRWEDRQCAVFTTWLNAVFHPEGDFS